MQNRLESQSCYFEEKGTATISGDQNSLDVSAELQSEDFYYLAPKTAALPELHRRDPADNFDIGAQSGLIGSLFSFVGDALKPYLATEIQKFLCDLLSEAVGVTLAETLNKTSTLLKPYITGDDVINDPLLAENQILEKQATCSDCVPELYDLQGNDTSVLRLIIDTLNTGISLKTINENLNLFLDENGEFKVPHGILPDALSFGTTDADVTRTNISLGLSDISIYGLDSFTSFELFEVIGKYTFQHQFNMTLLMVGVDFTFTMTPLDDPSAGFSEQFRRRRPRHRLLPRSHDACCRKEKYDSIQIGPLYDNPEVCIFGLFYNFSLPQARLEVGNIQAPTVTDLFAGQHRHAGKGGHGFRICPLPGGDAKGAAQPPGDDGARQHQRHRQRNRLQRKRG